MSELRKKSDISKKIDDDKKGVDKGTQDGKVVVSDAGHVDAADKKIKLTGTEEGAKEIIGGVSKALDLTKTAHEKIDGVLNKQFGDMNSLEKDLSNRSAGMNQDASAIKQELNAMKSKETGEAKGEMAKAEKSSVDDARYLKDSENKEKSARTAGEGEMKNQKSSIKAFKIRRG